MAGKVLIAWLLLASVCFGQSSRIVGGMDKDGRPITGYQVGDEPVRWQQQVQIMAPASPPYFLDGRHPYQWSNHGWGGSPFSKPFPGGVYEVRNASLDKTQKLGAWSQPATITVQSGAQLYCGGWNLPALQYEAGVIWKITCVSVKPECAGWGMNPGEEYVLISPNHWNVNNTSPSVACEPELHKLMVYKPLTYPLSRITFGGDLQQVAPPPIVVPTSIPNKRFRVAYCFVAETGETALSPPTPWSDPVQQAGWIDAQAVEFAMRINNHWPQGILGYHLYLQLENESQPWKRLPASHCHSKPTQPDDWLNQLWDRQPRCWQYFDDAPVHAPVAKPQSTLTGLHLALKETGWFPWDVVPIDIIVEVDKIEISCPVHDEWGTDGTGHPFKFLRKVMGKDNKTWVLEQKPSGTSRYWPLVNVSNSYSQWHNCKAHGYGASAGLSYDEPWGGQCFGNKFYGCNFDPGTSRCGGLSYGLMVCERSTSGRGGHTHSEGKYYNTDFTGDVAMRIGGNQTANINISDTLTPAISGKGRRNTSLWLICPNEVRMRGLWGADSFGGPVIFASGYSARLKADHIWKDQPSSAIIECQTGIGIDAKIMSGKLNLWSLYIPLTGIGYQPTLARFAHLPAKAKITLQDMQSQFSYWPTTADVVSPNCNLVEMKFEDTALDAQVALLEPTYAQWKKEYAAVFTGIPAPAEPPEPGMRVTIPGFTIPARTIKIPAIVVDGKASDPVTVTVTGSTIGPKTAVFNSFTGQEKVARRAWK